MTGRQFTITLSEEAIEAVAQRASQLVLAELRWLSEQPSPWLAGAQAAGEYLGVPRARVYKQLATIPHHRHGARLLFRRDDPDAWARASSGG